MSTHRFFSPAGAGDYVLRFCNCSFLFSGMHARVCVMLLGLLTLGSGVALMLGHIPLTPSALLQVVQNPQEHPLGMLLYEFRLPRIQLAWLSGAALGVAGCLTQALTRNRLGTPELLGINEGAFGAVLLALMVSPHGMLGPWWVGPLGALAAALGLMFAAGGLGTTGQRVLIIGVGLGALWRALTEWVLSTQDLQHASALYQWGSGSLSTQGQQAVQPLGMALLVFLPITLVGTRNFNLLQYHPEHMRSLGVRLHATQWQAFFTALVLAGLSVGLCGPIAFVALASPVFAANLTRTGQLPILSSACMGAMLVLMADTLGRTLMPNIELPAGVLCNVLGGPFLLWLLLQDQGKSS